MNEDIVIKNNIYDLQAEVYSPNINGLTIYFFVLMTLLTVAAIIPLFGIGSINQVTTTLGPVVPSKKLKIGVAVCHTLFSTFCSGDCSIVAACIDGNITQICTATTTTRGYFIDNLI